MGYAFLEASAKAKIANFATNLAALVIFVPQGAVIWKVGLLVGASNLVGGYVGARTAVSRGTGFVRVIFVVVVAAFVRQDRLRRRAPAAGLTSGPNPQQRLGPAHRNLPVSGQSLSR